MSLRQSKQTKKKEGSTVKSLSLFQRYDQSNDFKIEGLR